MKIEGIHVLIMASILSAISSFSLLIMKVAFGANIKTIPILICLMITAVTIPLIPRVKQRNLETKRRALLAKAR